MYNLLAAAIVAIIGKIIYECFFSELSPIPGPFLAKVTRGWHLWHQYQGRFHEKAQELQKQYGNFVRVAPDVVMICDTPELIDEAYGFGQNDFAKSAMMIPWATINNGQIAPSIAMSRDKVLHGKIRKPVAGIYSNTNILTFESATEDTLRLFLKQLDQRFMRGANKDKVCNIDRWVQYFAFDVIGTLTISRRFGFLEEGRDVENMLETLQKDFDYRGIVGTFPILDRLIKKNPIYLFLFRPSNPFIIRARNLMASRIAESDVEKASHKSDFLSRFLDAQKRYPDIVTPQVLASYIGTNYFAGSDTTAVILRGAIYQLLRHPAAKEKLVKELDENVKSYPVSYMTAIGLPYLTAVVRETLRVCPIGAILLERDVPKGPGLVLDNVKIPGGSVVATSAWVMHFNKKMYGEDAGEFKPERWLRQDGETEAEFQERLARWKHYDFSFGHGARVCLGRHIAEMEIFKAVPTLMGLLDIRLAHPEREWKIRGCFFAVQTDMDVTMRWREGIDPTQILTTRVE